MQPEDNTGMNDEGLEEGQVEDSPLKLIASDEEFGRDFESSETSSFNNRYKTGPVESSDEETTDLDYIDNVQDSEPGNNEQRGKENVEEDNENMSDNDIAQDEAWRKKQRVLEENREKREKYKKN